MKPSLQLRIGQQLAMTPQLQQAIRLLQMPAIELQAQIQEALDSNVLLEAVDEFGLDAAPAGQEADAAGEFDERSAGAEDGDETDDSDESVVEISDDWTEPTAAESEAPWSGSGTALSEPADTTGESLREHLLWQLELATLPEAARVIGRALVDAISDDGYLTESLDTIATAVAPEVQADATAVEAVLRVVQQFDPAGVGARSVAECIELQLRQLDPDTPGLALALALARDHLALVAAQQYALLQRQLHCKEAELTQALALVRGCQPRPGAAIQPSRTEYIIPDVFVRRGPQGWLVELNPAAVPRIRLNENYAGLITRAPDFAALRGQLQEARWLLRSLEIRNDTLLRVARAIVERQSAFLEHGEEAMQPLILRDVAAAIEMHESTVSRVTSGKYLHTPRGVFELRYFFSSQVPGDDGAGVSATAIRAKIRRLIAGETPEHPLSDSEIAERLAADGIPVARRTVAKYRESLGIASSGERRRAAQR
ncbi:MAG: RNA polymerase factor sigma-54 [Gammaproteobacteria bacterium]|nr:RNA polymerase factor sigma-54 [Gammaproteobacteria bacterium]